MCKYKKILITFLLYISTFLLICLVGITGVFADTISNYATRYYWGTADSTTINITDYRSGQDNKLTLYSGTAPTYANSETFNGFYNRINYEIVKGNIYTLTLVVSYSSLTESEWGINNVNSRLLNIDFAHCSNCTISAVSGSVRRYNASAPVSNNLYDYTVHISYTFVATSNASQWYIGSYTGDDRTMGVYQHNYTSVIMVTNLVISTDNSSTIINQNNTIINQNQQIIDQNNQNTQDIIDQNNQNTQDIIDNQNQNVQQQIDSQKVCKTIDKNSIIDNGYINSSGNVGSSNTYGVTDYLKINSSEIKVLNSYSAYYYCFYDVNKNKLSCSQSNSVSDNDIIDIPTNAEYVRFTINKSVNKPQYQICTNGNQALDNTLNDDDTSQATSEASDFFSSFDTDTFGLTSIITAPLNLIQSVLGSSCSELNLPLPYLDNKYLKLPCMSSIYSQYFGSFFTIYQTITYGIVAYWVVVRIFNMVKDFKNPEHDEIEVMDL